MNLGVRVAVSVVAELLSRHDDVQYLRFRTYRARSKDEDNPSPFTLDRALRHRRGSECLSIVPRPVTEDALRTVVDSLASERMLVGLCSRCEMTDCHAKHALLLDFKPLKSPNALKEVMAACGSVRYTGWLLETSRSYHFYGDDLVDEYEWLKFMGAWLLLEHLVDVRYVGHCIIERISCLRLSGNNDWSVPRVVQRIDNVSSKPQWLARGH